MDLDFWLYEVPDVLGATAHAQLQRQLQEACTAHAQCLGSPYKTKIDPFTYKTISACPWPCGCADFYGGLKEASTSKRSDFQ